MHIGFRYGAVSYRHAGPVNRFGIAGDQRMPLGQVPALGDPPVGAGAGQPTQFCNVVRFQLEAIGHEDMAQLVVGTTAGTGIQQKTCHPGIIDFSGGWVLKFLQAAAAAIVTKGFPLVVAQLLKCFSYPKVMRHDALLL